MLASLLVPLIVGYLAGSIPFGLILTRVSGLGDIRNIGSGNIGATNVLRTGNKSLAALTLLLDALKGTLPVLFFASWGGETAALIAGLGAFLGHIFPVWLQFRGGKGVATYLGVLFGISWPVAVMVCLCWLAVAFATRYSSLSALIAATLAPLALGASGRISAAVVCGVLTLLLILKHRANIERLRRGEEPKIGEKT